MRFGGHETFAVREGWLAKAVRVLHEDPDAFLSECPEDVLGVGRNMAKSIKHWMVAVGIATRLGTARAVSGYELTKIGELIRRHDPHFLRTSTWWMMHINLVNAPDLAGSWSWFFNRWTRPRFERSVVVEGLRRALLMQSKRTPSEKTLSRDVACLLGCYAQQIPAGLSDPEDASECPLQQLGLLRHFRASGVFVLNQSPKRVPLEVLAYAIVRSREATHCLLDDVIELSLRDLEQMPGGPGRACCLSAEALFDLVMGQQEDGVFAIANQAGERVVSLQGKPSEVWAADVLEATEGATHVAA